MYPVSIWESHKFLLSINRVQENYVKKERVFQIILKKYVFLTCQKCTTQDKCKAKRNYNFANIPHQLERTKNLSSWEELERSRTTGKNLDGLTNS
jgi:hypothetical protein